MATQKPGSPLSPGLVVIVFFLVLFVYLVTFFQLLLPSIVFTCVATGVSAILSQWSLNDQTEISLNVLNQKVSHSLLRGFVLGTPSMHCPIVYNSSLVFTSYLDRPSRLVRGESSGLSQIFPLYAYRIIHVSDLLDSPGICWGFSKSSLDIAYTDFHLKFLAQPLVYPNC